MCFKILNESVRFFHCHYTSTNAAFYVYSSQSVVGKPQTALSLGFFHIPGKVQVGDLVRSSGKERNENFPMWTLAFSLWSQQEIGQLEFTSWHQVLWHANFQQFSNNLEAQWSILLSGDNGFSDYFFGSSKNCLDLLPFNCISVFLNKHVRNYSVIDPLSQPIRIFLCFVSVFACVEFLFVCLLWFFFWLVGFNRFFRLQSWLKFICNSFKVFCDRKLCPSYLPIMYISIRIAHNSSILGNYFH